MAFVISKKSTYRGQETHIYYLVENYRVGNKVKRRTLVALGFQKTLENYLRVVSRYENRSLEDLAKAKKELYELIEYGRLPKNYRGLPYRAKQRITEAIVFYTEDLEKWQSRKKIAEQYVVPETM